MGGKFHLKCILYLLLQTVNITGFRNLNSALWKSPEIKYKDFNQWSDQAMLLVHFVLSIVLETHYSGIPEL
jgi:hypothetical protein